jgi:hypothetical protein
MAGYGDAVALFVKFGGILPGPFATIDFVGMFWVEYWVCFGVAEAWGLVEATGRRGGRFGGILEDRDCIGGRADGRGGR